MVIYIIRNKQTGREYITEATKAKMRVSGARPWSEKERAGHVGLARTDETCALIAAKKREWWASHKKG